MNMSFRIPGCEAEIKDNQVYIYSKGKSVTNAKYLLEAPSMEDASGEISFQIILELREENGKTILSVKPDMEWLLSEERQYPVRIRSDSCRNPEKCFYNDWCGRRKSKFSDW